MALERKFDVLFEILSSEQQILQRADQKAFTLLSILGVFSVFFIVHYTKIPPTSLSFIIIFLYFIFVLLTILNLVMVVSPRIKERKTGIPGKKEIAPIFFGGIIQYKTPEEYAEKLGVLLDNPDATYETFAKSVYSIGRINSYKNKHLRYGIFAFVISVSLEFVVIVTLYLHLLSENI
ncbi:MAG TPA: Pycsar system effector family protein [Ignavibacteriaceae bacterium]|nr:Pycsar system effector family protein [Ignavibacteriaceae bacterium]